MRVQIWGEKERFSGRVESQAWLQHTTLPVFIPSTRLWLLTNFDRPMPLNPTTHPHTLFLSLTFWLTAIFPLFIFLTLIHYLLPLAHFFLIFLTFTLFFSTPVGPFFPQSSGSTEGCGIRPEPPGFHSDTLYPDVISIYDVQLGKAVLAQGLFTV